MDNVIEGEIEENLTPIPRKQGESLTMDFPDAIRQIMDGKKVARMSWNNKDYCLMGEDEFLTVFTGDKLHRWLISLGDTSGNDWYVVKEQE